MTNGKTGVAFFDFDGTITSKDSFLEFIKYSEGSTKFYFGVIYNLPLILLYYFGLCSRHQLKEHFFSFFYKDKPPFEVEKKGGDFGKLVIPGLCYTGALDLIKWHQEKGHDVYILTASSKIWLGEWCMLHDVNLISTEFEIVQGRYTGRISGRNCRGYEKLSRIQVILSGYDFSQTYGYGESISDKYYLERLNIHFRMPLSEKNMGQIWLKLKSD